MRVIGRRFATYPQPERTEGEWSEFWADHVDTLGHLPEPAIEAGMAAWVRSPGADFLPKPWKLLELANTAPTRAALAFARARQATRLAASTPKPAAACPMVADLAKSIASRRRSEPTLEEKEKVRAMCREYIAIDDARKANAKRSPTPLPDTAGEVGEQGITTALAALLTRQRSGSPRGGDG